MTWRAPVIRGSSLLMEAMWTYAFAAFAVAAISDGGDPSFLGVCAVVLFSYTISRLLQNSELSLGVLRVWGTALSFLVFYVIVRADFFGDWRVWNFDWANDLFNHTESSMRAHTPAVFGVPIMWAFWMRGILRGQETTTFEDVVRSFAIGVLVIAVVEVFQGSLDDSPALVGQIAVPYVAFGLFAIGLAHSSRAETDRGRPFERTLLTTIGVSVVALAFLAAVVALFDLATGWEAARSGSQALLDAGKQVGAIVAWPVIKLMDGMFAFLIWLRDLVLGTPKPPDPSQLQAEQAESCVQTLMRDQGLNFQQALDQCNPKPHELPEWVKLIVRFILATPVVGLIVLMTALLFSRFRKRSKLGEVKESTYQQGRLASDLSDLWRGLLGRLRPSFALGRDHLDPVRKLYFEMLDDGERRGVRRQAWQTPDEHAPRLDIAYRGPTPTQITGAFNEARYGGRQAPEPEVRRLRQEWDELRRQQGM